MSPIKQNQHHHYTDHRHRHFTDSGWSHRPRGSQLVKSGTSRKASFSPPSSPHPALLSELINIPRTFLPLLMTFPLRVSARILFFKTQLKCPLFPGSLCQPAIPDVSLSSVLPTHTGACHLSTLKAVAEAQCAFATTGLRKTLQNQYENPSRWPQKGCPFFLEQAPRGCKSFPYRRHGMTRDPRVILIVQR